ncbi:5,10-methylene-tetrahydrofolate dehydrogenase [Sorangium cellulosum]|uniref:Bifunctional protein FolD n=1 Tax=Sorangium cellulosum TaxID=56 RepID=A0A2L0EUR0_SORCE|nr:bifunctional methylenetetrahydrofolate dehydrogenase/methenyltetrahydrofolate cyclohydrolase FolD [Sorangium cellulosum]AUX43036.1 5,10-methylene-tetrahydrofolate dehydrogenase [Sorangium cellulosum]
MTAKILDGKAIAQKVREEVREGVARFAATHGRPPGLDVLLVGDDPGSVGFTRSKEKASNELGMRGRLHRLPEGTTESELLARLAELNADDAVDGILVQLPLPGHIREHRALDAIDPAKDVDGLHPVNAGLLALDRPGGIAPCTPSGCMRLLAEAGVPIAGARAVVVGRGKLVGRPMAALLLAHHATVAVAHSHTRDLRAICREADILVAAAGQAKLIGGDWIKEGATVIDVGLNRNEAGKLVGDVDFDAAKERAAWITPVPGGVGPMTIAALLATTLRAAEARAAKQPP